MAKRSKIADAFEELETPEISEDEQDEANEFIGDTFLADADADELTDEEVAAEVERLDEHKRQLMERSRTRGKADPKARTGRQSKAQAEAAARNLQREREVQWAPANSLDAPPPQPGMEQRWIRTELGNKNDPKNWARKTRERWVPRRLDTVPASYAPPTLAHATLGEVICIDGLVLCERPFELGLARKKYFDQRNLRQQAAAARQRLDQVHGDGRKVTVEDRADLPTTIGRGKRRPTVQE